MNKLEKFVAAWKVLLFSLVFSSATFAQNVSIFPPVGVAQLVPGTSNCYQLTTEQTSVLGAIWFDPQIDVSQPFDIWVTLNFGDIFQWNGANLQDIYPEAGGGADGIAFVLQQVSSAAGNLGEAIGYGNLDPSIAVEFDPYYNFNADPVYDHIAISRNGDHVHTTAPYGNYSEGALIPGSTIVPALGTDPVADNIHTGQDYEARFKWDPATSELTVWFDCELKFVHQEDIINTIFNGNGQVFYGFTSATGSEYNFHEVCVIYNSSTFEMPDQTICAGESVILDATIPGANMPSISYSWSPTTGLSDPTSPNPTATPLTTTTYTCTISSSCYPDPITESVTVNVTSVPGPIIDAAGPFCQTDPATILTAQPPGGTWLGTGVTNATTGGFDPSLVSGSTEIVYIAPGICTGSDTLDITVVDPSPVTITGSVNEGCVPLTVQFQATPNSTGNNCFWDFGDGNTATDCGSVTHTYMTAGNFDVTYNTSAASANCQSTITEDDFVEVLPIITPTIDAAGPFCETDDLVYLTAQPQGGTWQGAGITNGVAGEFDPTLVAGTTSVIYTAPGSCPENDTIDIEIIEWTIVTITADVIEGCVPLTVQFESDAVGIGNNCTWDFGDGSTSTGCGTVTHTYNGTGCFDVAYTVENATAACQSVVTENDLVCTYPIPHADFTYYPYDITYPLNNEVQFTNTSSNADSVSWSFTGFGTSSEWDPTIEFETNGSAAINVCLDAISEHGCEDVTCATITVSEDLIFYVPNAFTPDDDEFNQTFFPVFTSGFSPFDYTLLIFDRWGEIIFESHDTQVGWDGVYAGDLVQDGVYTWKIEFKTSDTDERKKVVGHVNVLR